MAAGPGATGTAQWYDAGSPSGTGSAGGGRRHAGSWRWAEAARSDLARRREAVPHVGDVYLVALPRGLAEEPLDPRHELGLVLVAPQGLGGGLGADHDLFNVEGTDFLRRLLPRRRR